MAAAIEEVIQRLLAQAAALWPEAPPQKIAITGQIKRPYSTSFRLALLPADPGNAPRPPQAVYAKIINPTRKNSGGTQKYAERLQREFEIPRLLHTRLSPAPDLGLVRPVTYYSDLLCLITEEAPGRMLAELIAATATRWRPRRAWQNTALHCRRAGRLLAALQAATPEAHVLAGSELLEYVEVRLQRLVENPDIPFSKAHAGAVRRYLEKMLGQIPAEQLRQCGCHSDYAPFNLLASTERLTVFDFAMFKTGSIYNDAAYFCHRLQGYLHKPTFSAAAIHALQQAFLDGYNQAAGRGQQRLEQDLMFRVFLIKHALNNYSAIMRKRVAGGPAAHLSLPVRLFNRRVYRRYNEWLLRACQ